MIDADSDALAEPPDQQWVRERIVAVLERPESPWRTVEEIAIETGLSRALILLAVNSDKLLGKVIKVAPLRSQQGRLLLTTKERFWREATFTEKFIDVFATERPEVLDA